VRIARGSLRTTRKVRQPTVQRLTFFPVDWCCKIMKKSIKKRRKNGLTTLCFFLTKQA
jgi:hypothetical protein